MTVHTLSPLADYHASLATELVPYHGALVPLRFSDPTREHRAVRNAAGVFDFSFRAHFALKGEDRSRYLHRIVSNDIKKLAPGQGIYATLLNAQGHILVDFRVYCTDESLVIDTDADLRDKAMQALGRYIIGDRVQIEPVELTALAVQGPRSRACLQNLLQIELSLSQEYDHTAASFEGHPVRVVRASSTGEEGYEVWVESQHALPIWQALVSSSIVGGSSAGGELEACGVTALETLRIEAGIPRYGPDMGEDTLPLEADILSALSFNKGCYIGQEIVERARSRGHVNWKLSGVVVQSAAVPAAGEKLLSAGKAIGEITSACVSPTLSKTIALAYLRREVTQPGTELALASGAAAEVTALPFYTRSNS